MIRIRLDNLILEELPQGWDDLTTSVNVDRSLLFARLVNIDTRLRWYRDGYQYLLDRYRQVNGCTQVSLVIEDDPRDIGAWEIVYRGIIKLAAARWSYEPDSVETPVEDDGWYSFLSNNKGIEVNVTLPQTKNGLTTLLIQPKVVQLYDPASGTYDNVARDMYRVHDVLEWIVRYLSDEQVGFRSDVLDTGDFRNYFLQTGYRLRTQQTDSLPLTLTLEDALKEVSKAFALGCQLQFTGARPILRVEPVAYFYDNTPELQLDHQQPVEVTTDVARLYATVSAGTQETQPQGTGLQFPESVRWYGFGKEQFYLLGQCNLSANLDLVRDWVVSSNVIEELAVNNVDTWDDNVFLIQTYDPNIGGVYNATQSNWLAANTPPFFYNEDLTNEKCTQRWLGGIPSSLAAELGAIATGRFRAASNVPTAYSFPPTTNINQANYNWTPVLFQDETTPPNFDTGVYDPTLSRWYTPGSGLFELNAEMLVQHFMPANTTGYYSGSAQQTYTIRFLRYNAANTLQSTYISPVFLMDWDQYHLPGGCLWPSQGLFITKTFNWTKAVPCDAGDYVVPQLAQSTAWSANGCPTDPLAFLTQTRIGAGSFFRCTRTTELADFTEYVNPDAARNVLVKFETPLTRRQLRGVLDNLSGAITVTTNGRTFKGWIERLKHDAGTNLADITLLTSKNLLP